MPTREAETTSGAKEGETMKKSDLPKKTMSKKKERASEVPSDEEIRELESMEISEKVKEEVCQEVAEKMGISSFHSPVHTGLYQVSSWLAATRVLNATNAHLEAI